MKLPIVAEIPPTEREDVALGLGIMLTGVMKEQALAVLVAPEDLAETAEEAHRLLREIAECRRSA